MTPRPGPEPEREGGPEAAGGPAGEDRAARGAAARGGGRAARAVPPRQALADSVYEAVKAMVMDHEIAPGARVGIDALSRALRVSPTPVREALARLEADGLVTKRSLAGYRATDLLTAEGLEELFEMRLLLEPRAAALAARHADEAQFDALEDLLERMRGGPDSGGRYADYREFAALDTRFHHTIAAASGRALLADAVDRLHAHLHIFRLSTMPGAGEPTVAEHERIVRAILRRSPERAGEAMAAHLDASLDRQRRRRGTRTRPGEGGKGGAG